MDQDTDGDWTTQGIHVGSDIDDGSLLVWIGKREVVRTTKFQFDDETFGYDESDFGYVLTPPSRSKPIFYHPRMLRYLHF